MADLAAAVEGGDIDELIGVINGLCLDGDWDGLEELARRCRAALERGRQLWPVAAHADYRLALEAPARLAARTIEPGRGRFAPGPLTEVLASTHRWDDLAPHLPAGPLAGVVAQERVLRGEDLTADERVDPSARELPLRLAEWEPAYALATFHPDRADLPAPALEVTGMPQPVHEHPGEEAGSAANVDEDAGEGRRALLDLVTTWTGESSGRAEAVAVEGGAADAATLLAARPRQLVPVTNGSAVALMAWAGASGGAHGRRRGAAAGRFAAWWALAALAGMLDEWPPPADTLGEALAELRFYELRTEGSQTGWRLSLAVESPADELAWAVWAADPAEAVAPAPG
ncbi:MAG TPA: hypothetical protein VFA11_01190 [Acidimicrobiales bacterium]|nr:hypothetical protein [Acidimicrobiales bacterium]